MSLPEADDPAKYSSHEEESADDGEESDHTLRGKLRRFVAATPDADGAQAEEVERAALQMVAAGEEPSVIEERLTSEFGVDEP